MLAVWVSGLAVLERLDKGIQKGGGYKIKKKQKKNNKQTNKKKMRKIKLSPFPKPSLNTKEYLIPT